MFDWLPAADERALLIGLITSLKLFGLALVGAFGVGIPVGLLTVHFPRSVGRFVTAYGMFAAAAPPIVVLYWMHYPAQTFLGVIAPPFVSALAALVVIGAGFVCYAVSGTLRDFP